MTALSPVPAALRRAVLLSREKTAEILSVQPATLARWAHEGNFDLPMVRVGRSVRYRLSDVESFIERNTVAGDVT